MNEKQPAPEDEPAAAGDAAAVPEECSGAEIDDLLAALASCEVPMPKVGDLPPSPKQKLEIALTTAKPSVPPGGRVEVTLTLKNRHGEPLALFFTADPIPRFDLEALDARGKRLDRPSGRPPKHDAKDAEAKAARVILAPGGVARVKLEWEASKMRWAPERLRGFTGRGYPTAPAGPLPRGKVILRAVVPLLGVFERGGLEPPKTTIDVGG